jgi:peptidoglycan/LPS O-acetylase OafA/YrhL
LGAIAMAVPGVVLYAKDPGAATYQLNGLLLLPLVGLILYALHRTLPVRMQWGAALLLAPLGPAGYLIWPNDQWWNYGALTPLPLFALAMLRQAHRIEERPEEPEPSYGGWPDRPWGPP